MQTYVDNNIDNVAVVSDSAHSVRLYTYETIIITIIQLSSKIVVRTSLQRGVSMTIIWLMYDL